MAKKKKWNGLVELVRPLGSTNPMDWEYGGSAIMPMVTLGKLSEEKFNLSDREVWWIYVEVDDEEV